MATPSWGDLEGSSLVYALVTGGQAVEFARRLHTINLTESVYRYDFRTRTIKELNEASVGQLKNWEIPRSAGTVSRAVNFEVQCRTETQEGIRVEPDSFCIEPKGRNVVAAQFSPSGAYWFILSAEGEHYVLPENLIGFGPSKKTLLAYGQHYLQVISVAEQDVVGHALPLGFETAGPPFQVDWVDDGHIVIARIGYFRRDQWLAVVHVDDLLGRRQ